MSFTKSVSITFITQISAYAFMWITNILLARFLGPAGKGILVIALLVLNYLFIFGNLGLAAPIVYYVSKDKYELKDIVSSLITLTILLGFFLVALSLFLLTNFSFAFLKGVSPFYIGIAIFGLPFKLLNSFLNSIFLAKKQIKKYNILSALSSIIFLITFLIFLLFSKNILLNALLCQVLSTGIVSVIVIFLIHKLSSITLKINLAFLKDSLKFAMKTYLDNLTSFFNYRLDMFLVNYFLTSNAVGYYSLAVGLAEFIWYIPGATSTILFPQIASMKSSNDAKEFTPIICRNIIMITFLMALFFLIFGRFLIRVVYGDVFLPSVFPLWILLPGVVMLSINKIVTSDLMGRGKPIFATIISGLVLVITILLDFILIPKLGVNGAALASTIAYTTATFFGLCCYLKISGNYLLDVIIVKFEDLLVYKTLLLKLTNRVSLRIANSGD